MSYKIEDSSPVLAEWNETDTSQFTMVQGNGNGGVGVGGDWTLAVSTMAGSDLPALSVTANNADPTGFAIWTFDDADPALWKWFMLDWWATHQQSASGNNMYVGMLLNYEDNNHWMAIRFAGTDDYDLFGRNNGVAYSTSFVAQAIVEDTAFGNPVRIACRCGWASAVDNPWVIATMADPFSSNASGRILASAANASWNGLGAYAPKVGIVAENYSAADTEYTTFRILKR